MDQPHHDHPIVLSWRWNFLASATVQRGREVGQPLEKPQLAAPVATDGYATGSHLGKGATNGATRCPSVYSINEAQSNHGWKYEHSPENVTD